MEEEGIGLVLTKATDLRMKISNCIHKANDPSPKKENGDSGDEDGDGEEEDEESQRLFNICDALEALENQLSNLQVRIPKTPNFFLAWFCLYFFFFFKALIFDGLVCHLQLGA